MHDIVVGVGGGGFIINRWGLVRRQSIGRTNLAEHVGDDRRQKDVPIAGDGRPELDRQIFEAVLKKPIERSRSHMSIPPGETRGPRTCLLRHHDEASAKNNTS